MQEQYNPEIAKYEARIESLIQVIVENSSQEPSKGALIETVRDYTGDIEQNLRVILEKSQVQQEQIKSYTKRLVAGALELALVNHNNLGSLIVIEEEIKEIIIRSRRLHNPEEDIFNLNNYPKPKTIEKRIRANGKQALKKFLEEYVFPREPLSKCSKPSVGIIHTGIVDIYEAPRRGDTEREYNGPSPYEEF